jgi:hypothetical protein
MLHPLPYPADEIRDEVRHSLDNAAATLMRLKVYFRGHEKDESQLQHLEIRIQAAVATCNSLQWPTTCVGNCWTEDAHLQRKGETTELRVTQDGEILPPGVE